MCDPADRLILAQISTIWNFDQNISILALDTETTAQTVIGKNLLLDIVRLLYSEHSC